MEELAPLTIGAVQVPMESLTLLGFIVPVHVSPLFQLVRAMGERTSVPIFAPAIGLPKFTDFCFEFLLKTLSWFTVSISICLSNFLSSSQW